MKFFCDKCLESDERLKETESGEFLCVHCGGVIFENEDELIEYNINSTFGLCTDERIKKKGDPKEYGN